MGLNFTKTSHMWFFGIVLPLVSWSSSQWILSNFPTWPSWFEGPSPLFVYGVIFFVFNKWLWRWNGFRKLGIVWFPNLSGRWKGEQQSSYQKNGKNLKVDGRLEIEQSFSRVCVRGYYEKSESQSVTANFSELNGEVYLFYTYDNDPTSMKSGTMQKHKGTGKIKRLPKENKTTGCYWNSIGNYGEMNYDFEQSDLLGRF